MLKRVGRLREAPQLIPDTQGPLRFRTAGQRQTCICRGTLAILNGYDDLFHINNSIFYYGIVGLAGWRLGHTVVMWLFGVMEIVNMALYKPSSEYHGSNHDTTLPFYGREREEGLVLLLPPPRGRGLAGSWVGTQTDVL